MTEGPPQTLDSGPEKNPTQEEIMAVLEKLTGSKEYTEVRRLEDEHGIYLWEISITTEDGHTEYEYNRAGPNPNPKSKGLQTAVYATYYDKDGMPISGSSVALLIGNVWNIDLLDLKFP
jgi:hypothetical protein